MARVLRIAVATLVDADDRLLLVRKRGTAAFMLPGGKIEPGECALDALARELAEELGVRLDRGATRPLGRFAAPAANEPDTVVEAEAFLAVVDGEPRPAAEIEELRWHALAAPEPPDLAPLLVQHILPLLRAGARAPSA